MPAREEVNIKLYIKRVGKEVRRSYTVCTPTKGPWGGG
jgi:hypothetical protein